MRILYFSAILTFLTHHHVQIEVHSAVKPADHLGAPVALLNALLTDLMVAILATELLYWLRLIATVAVIFYVLFLMLLNLNILLDLQRALHQLHSLLSIILVLVGLAVWANSRLEVLIHNIILLMEAKHKKK